MIPLDTTLGAAAAQHAAHRGLGPSGRLRIAFELSDLTHRLALAGIRKRQPELTDCEAMAVLVQVLYGKVRR